jgi:hypothetical protein
MRRRTIHSVRLPKLCIIVFVLSFSWISVIEATKRKNATELARRRFRWRTSTIAARVDSTNESDRELPRERSFLKRIRQEGKCSEFEDLARREARRQRWLRRSDESTTKTAYSMAVLATLAYLPFHKQMPLESTSFRLATPPCSKKEQSSTMLLKIREQLCRLRQFLQRLLEDQLLVQGDRYREERKNVRVDGDLWCREKIDLMHNMEKDEGNPKHSFAYYLFDWYEPTSVPGVKYHDTDLLVSTQGNHSLELAFAGTASAADHVTNVQTFESASHSKLFHGGNRTSGTSIEGSLHRGFLNAYSRVQRGSVLRLYPNGNKSELTHSLDQRYEHCTWDALLPVPVTKKKRQARESKNATNSTDLPANATDNLLPNNSEPIEDDESYTTSQETSGTDNISVHKKGGCRSRDEHLMTTLRELVTSALLSGKAVHISGHSLGGGLATLLGLDVVINFPHVPVTRLHLWTFGAPQVADDVFLKSAMKAAPRLRLFVEKNGNGRVHRFVTLSDDCKVDFVSTVAGRALPSHGSNLRGKAARTFGGVRGTVVHFADPHYLLTPDQYESNPIPAANSSTNATTQGQPKTTTKSTIAAHSTINYLLGISRESRDHPLSTDLSSPVMREWLGEDKPTPVGNITTVE